MRRLVLFDCDGTLVDSQYEIVESMVHAFETHELSAPSRADILAIVGLSVPEAIAVLAPAADAHLQATLASEFRAGSARQRLTGGRADVLFDGAREAIQTLAGRDDIVLGVATGKSRRGVQRLFDGYGWHGHFETVQTADTNPSKPHPGMITAAISEVGAAPETTLMIGDTSFDMAMARAAGVTAIGVAWGYHPVADISAAGAHRVVANFTDLLTTILPAGS